MRCIQNSVLGPTVGIFEKKVDHSLDGGNFELPEKLAAVEAKPTHVYTQERLPGLALCGNENEICLRQYAGNDGVNRFAVPHSNLSDI